MTEDDKDRVALIRRGNELYNQGDIKNALKIFLATNYIDGIIRVADYFFYDKGDKITGVRLYKKAGQQKRIEDFVWQAAQTIKILLQEDREARVREEEITQSTEEAPPIENWSPVEIKVSDLMNPKQKDQKK